MKIPNQSDTSITNTAAEKFNLLADTGAQLHCHKNKGLFLLRQIKHSAWILRYTDAAGARRKLTIGNYPSLKPREAAYKAREITQGICNGTDPLVAKEKKKEEAKLKAMQTLEAFLEGPYRLHQSRKKNQGKATLNLIRSNFSEWLSLPMPDISKQKIISWQVKREHEVKRSTIIRAYGALKTLLNFATKEGFITRNPLADVTLMAPQASPTEGDSRNIRRVLSQSELQTLQQSITRFDQELRAKRRRSRLHGKPNLPDLENVTFAHWFVPFFYCALHLGMRPGDLYALRWEHINFNFRRLIKTLEKTKHHQESTRVELPLNSTIFDILSKWHKQQGEPAEGLVFRSPITEKELNRLAHGKSWKAVKKIAGNNIPAELQFYSLRHHFISTLVLSGTPMFIVAKLAGHKSVKMIEKHYGHLAPSYAVDAMKVLEQSFLDIDVTARKTGSE